MNTKRNVVMDVLYDLHARKLSLPAGILAVLLVAIMVVLPKQPAPEPTAAPAPGQAAPAEDVVAAPARITQNVTFFGGTLALDAGLNVFRKKNPFGAIKSSNCKTSESGGGSAVECTSKSGDKVSCVAGDESLECGSGGVNDLSGGGTGGGGVGVPGPGLPTVPDDDGSGDDTGGDDEEVDGTVTYVITGTYDETAVKNVESGKGIPDDDNPMLLYAGSDDDGEHAQFLIADGLSVQGAEVDNDLGLVSLAKGDQIVLTQADGTSHSFTLTKITATEK